MPPPILGHTFVDSGPIFTTGMHHHHDVHMTTYGHSDMYVPDAAPAYYGGSDMYVPDTGSGGNYGGSDMYVPSC